MGAEADALGAAGEEVEGGEGLEVGLVGEEGCYSVGGVGVEGCDLAGEDDVVADPDVVEAEVVGPLGEGAELVGAGEGAAGGYGCAEGYGHNFLRGVAGLGWG